jgi:hypothetical protein
MSGRLTARREPFRLDGARLKVRLGLAETESLKAFAHEHSLSLSEAVRRLVRTVLKRGHLSRLEEDDTDRAALLEELVLLNLIVSEQTLKALETITPQGPGMADEFLVAATQSVQRRLAHGPSLEPVRRIGVQD